MRLGTHPGTPNDALIPITDIKVMQASGESDESGLLLVNPSSRKVLLLKANGEQVLVAGSGKECKGPSDKCGDGGPPQDVRFSTPTSVAVSSTGEIAVLDSSERIWVISRDRKTIKTLVEMRQRVTVGAHTNDEHQVKLKRFASVIAARDGGFVVSEHHDFTRTAPDEGPVHVNPKTAPRIWKVGLHGEIELLAGGGETALTPAGSENAFDTMFDSVELIADTAEGIVFKANGEALFDSPNHFTLRRDHHINRAIDLRPVEEYGERTRVGRAVPAPNGDWVVESGLNNFYTVSHDGSRSTRLLKGMDMPIPSAWAVANDGTLFIAGGQRIFVASQTENVDLSLRELCAHAVSKRSDIAQLNHASRDTESIEREISSAAKGKTKVDSPFHRDDQINHHTDGSAKGKEKTIDVPVQNPGLDGDREKTGDESVRNQRLLVGSTLIPEELQPALLAAPFTAWSKTVLRRSLADSEPEREIEGELPTTCARIAFNNEIGLAAWRRGGRVFASERVGDGPWSRPKLLGERTGEQDGNVEVVVNDAGQAFVIWTRRLGDSLLIDGAIRSVGGHWSGAQALLPPGNSLDTEGKHLTRDQIAVGPDGTIALAWVSREGNQRRLQLRRRSTTGHWTPVKTVIETTGSIDNTSIHVGANRQVTAIWREQETQQVQPPADPHPNEGEANLRYTYTLKLRLLDPQGAFSDPETLSGPSKSYIHFQFVSNRRGDAALAWLDLVRGADTATTRSDATSTTAALTDPFGSDHGELESANENDDEANSKSEAGSEADDKAKSESETGSEADDKANSKSEAGSEADDKAGDSEDRDRTVIATDCGSDKDGRDWLPLRTSKDLENLGDEKPDRSNSQRTSTTSNSSSSQDTTETFFSEPHTGNGSVFGEFEDSELIAKVRLLKVGENWGEAVEPFAPPFAEGRLAKPRFVGLNINEPGDVLAYALAGSADSSMASINRAGQWSEIRLTPDLHESETQKLNSQLEDNGTVTVVRTSFTELSEPDSPKCNFSRRSEIGTLAALGDCYAMVNPIPVGSANASDYAVTVSDLGLIRIGSRSFYHWTELTAHGIQPYLAELLDGKWQKLNPSEVARALRWLGNIASLQAHRIEDGFGG